MDFKKAPFEFVPAKAGGRYSHTVSKKRANFGKL